MKKLSRTSAALIIASTTVLAGAAHANALDFPFKSDAEYPVFVVESTASYQEVNQALQQAMSQGIMAEQGEAINYPAIDTSSSKTRAQVMQEYQEWARTHDTRVPY